MAATVVADCGEPPLVAGVVSWAHDSIRDCSLGSLHLSVWRLPSNEEKHVSGLKKHLSSLTKRPHSERIQT